MKIFGRPLLQTFNVGVLLAPPLGIGDSAGTARGDVAEISPKMSLASEPDMLRTVGALQIEVRFQLKHTQCRDEVCKACVSSEIRDILMIVASSQVSAAEYSVSGLIVSGVLVLGGCSAPFS